jgi:hypothetical protein
MFQTMTRLWLCLALGGCNAGPVPQDDCELFCATVQRCETATYKPTCIVTCTEVMEAQDDDCQTAWSSFAQCSNDAVCRLVGSLCASEWLDTQRYCGAVFN